MKEKVMSNIEFENAKIIFKNFAGKASQYNQAGDRNFCVIIPEIDLANALKDDGWNVRFRESREDGEPPVPYLQVKVSYDHKPPKVVLISNGGKTVLDEVGITALDWADIKEVDLVVSPYNWTVNGKSGVKAYLKSLYVTIDDDRFASKYSDLEEQ